MLLMFKELDCDLCRELIQHEQDFILARTHYKMDEARALAKEIVMVAFDLQKKQQLPRIETGSKSFCS